jgi:hypothetical protein
MKMEGTQQVELSVVASTRTVVHAEILVGGKHTPFLSWLDFLLITVLNI